MLLTRQTKMACNYFASHAETSKGLPIKSIREKVLASKMMHRCFLPELVFTKLKGGAVWGLSITLAMALFSLSFLLLKSSSNYLALGLQNTPWIGLTLLAIMSLGMFDGRHTRRRQEIECQEGIGKND